MRTEYYDELPSSFVEACERADAKQARLKVVPSANGRATERLRRFQLVPFNQLSPGTSSPYLVKGLIP